MFSEVQYHQGPDLILLGHQGHTQDTDQSKYYIAESVEPPKNMVYGKCCEILKTFSFLISIKMLVIIAVVYKMLVRIASREDHDQKQPDSGLCCLSRPF